MSKVKEIAMRAVGFALAIACVFSAGFFLPAACTSEPTYYVYRTSVGIIGWKDGKCVRGLFVRHDSSNLLNRDGKPVTCDTIMLQVNDGELDKLKAKHNGN